MNPRLSPSGPQLFGQLGVVELAAGSSTAYRNTHAGKQIQVGVGLASTLVISDDEDGGWQLGDSMLLLKIGAGTFTVAGAAGVTVRTAETLQLLGADVAAWLSKTGDNEWLLYGSLLPL